MDRYATFAELQAAETEGRDFAIVAVDRPGAHTAILAPHGGNIEAGTSELATAIAGCEHRLYCFDGIRDGSFEFLHLTSTRFDEPRCLHLVATATRVVAVHGEGGDERVTYLGGADRALAAGIAHALHDAGFAVATHRNPRLLGVSPRNVCNRGATGAGVQIEIGRGLRETFFRSLWPQDRAYVTPAFHAFVRAVRTALGPAPAELRARTVAEEVPTSSGCDPR